MKHTVSPFLGMLGLLLVYPASAPLAQQEKVSLDIDKGAVHFKINGQLAGRYHSAGYAKPILWPVHAPNGVAVTRDYPMGPMFPGGSKDHPHQQSVWFCHGDVIPKGMELKLKVKGVDGVDFWSLNPNAGKIVCTDVKKGKAGSFWAGIDTTNEWRTPDGVKIMDEKRTVTLYDFGKARLWVFDVDLHASVCPIIFGDTKEGAMGVRVHDTLCEKGGTGQIENADGKKTEKECWGQLSHWCDYSGTIDGKKAGIAILDDPKNAHPSAYHARGYGLMSANPFGRKKAAFPATKGNAKLVELDKGEHLKLRYGVLVHDGLTGDIKMPEYYNRFVTLGAKGQQQ